MIIFCFNIVSIVSFGILLLSFSCAAVLSKCKKFLSVYIGNQKLDVNANIKVISYKQLQNGSSVLGRLCVRCIFYNVLVQLF